jgi:uncharacterized membrane protein (UPF0136 family)
MPVCPVCTIAVAGGVGLCRYLGIDDLISGVWIGALFFSLSLLTIEWLNKRKIKFLFRKPLVFIFWYGLTIFPLMKIGIIGHPQNKFFGIDKLIFGIFSGSVVFLLSILFENYLRKKNQGKVYFKFQKVIIPILFLIILSLIFWRVC